MNRYRFIMRGVSDMSRKVNPTTRNGYYSSGHSIKEAFDDLMRRCPPIPGKWYVFHRID